LSKVTVSAGICGFSTVIKVRKLDEKRVRIKVVSPCEMIKKMGEELKEVDWTQAITRSMCNSVIYQIANRHVHHTACPVPSAILKAVEVELGLALPKDVAMKIEKSTNFNENF